MPSRARARAPPASPPKSGAACDPSRTVAGPVRRRSPRAASRPAPGVEALFLSFSGGEALFLSLSGGSLPTLASSSSRLLPSAASFLRRPRRRAAAAVPFQCARPAAQWPLRQRRRAGAGMRQRTGGADGFFFCFFVFGKCLLSASFNTRQNFCRVREEKHSAKVPFADVCLPCVVCREQHTTNILPWGK